MINVKWDRWTRRCEYWIQRSSTWYRIS